MNGNTEGSFPMSKHDESSTASTPAAERRISRRRLLELGGVTTLGAAVGRVLGPGASSALAQNVPPDTDYSLPDTGEVPEVATPDKRFELVAGEGEVVIDEGVVYQGMMFDGTIPSSLHLMDEGDIVEVSVRNEGRFTHGLSYHATYRSTPPKVGNIAPGQTKQETFKASYPGVFMYHCAPGGQGIMMHTGFGMYGMAVVEPQTKPYRLEAELGREPDVKLYLLQHEIYASGTDYVEGRPLYTMFNGYNYRHFDEPIMVRPGDYVRIYYLNVGPNLTASLHLVGGIWDYMYYQGNPNNVMVGGQSATTAPTDSWVLEFRVPEAGPYVLVSHAFGTQAARGAVGLFMADPNAQRRPVVAWSDAPRTLPEPAERRRVVNTFAPGSRDLDPPRIYRPGEEVLIRIVGNSYSPKIAHVPAGTTVTWINEDVFDALEGELTGKHNVVTTSGPETVAGPMLNHAETWSYTFDTPGDYEYICAVHPYMVGRLKVGDPA